jgi:hypothetical protein
MSEERKGLTRPQLLNGDHGEYHPMTPRCRRWQFRLHALSNDAKKVITYQLVKEIQRLTEPRNNSTRRRGKRPSRGTVSHRGANGRPGSGR